MLFLSPEATREIEKLIKQPHKTPEERLAIAEKILEIDPESGNAHLVIAIDLSEQGKWTAAEEHLWQGVRLWPMQYGFYINLGVARLRQDPKGRMSPHLLRIAMSHLAAFREIPEAAQEHLSNAIPDEDADFSDPDEFVRMIEAFDEGPMPEISAADRQLLAPFQTIAQLHLDAALERVDAAATLARFEANRDECVRLARAFVRTWILHDEPVDDHALAHMIALMGEYGPAEYIEDVWDIRSSDDYDVDDAINWSLMRLGQRFPAEFVAYVRKVNESADLIQRCNTADHLNLMGLRADIPDALAGLLDNFESFPCNMEAGYLLTAVYEGLTDQGQLDRGEALLARYKPLLGKKGRDVLETYLNSAEGYEPLIADRHYDTLTIEEVLNGGLLELDSDDEDEYLSDDSDFEPVIAEALPGRNDPCWCGSGKKYKKCHLDSDAAGKHLH
ncbi:MAG TPA: SEC-C metal-binding domain-containing protein [Candidatus Limnocylindrales bacterium]|nr:SEC-C metal-binding domain-containing protein [Candidatus Limnocylindrales bacterium]